MKLIVIRMQFNEVVYMMQHVIHSSVMEEKFVAPYNCLFLIKINIYYSNVNVHIQIIDGLLV